MTIIDGKQLSQSIKDEIKESVAQLRRGAARYRKRTQ